MRHTACRANITGLLVWQMQDILDLEVLIRSGSPIEQQRARVC